MAAHLGELDAALEACVAVLALLGVQGIHLLEDLQVAPHPGVHTTRRAAAAPASTITTSSAATAPASKVTSATVTSATAAVAAATVATAVPAAVSSAVPAAAAAATATAALFARLPGRVHAGVADLVHHLV